MLALIFQHPVAEEVRLKKEGCGYHRKCLAEEREHEGEDMQVNCCIQRQGGEIF